MGVIKLETSALETLYGSQFTKTTQLIEPIIPPPPPPHHPRNTTVYHFKLQKTWKFFCLRPTSYTVWAKMVSMEGLHVLLSRFYMFWESFLKTKFTTQDWIFLDIRGIYENGNSSNLRTIWWRFSLPRVKLVEREQSQSEIQRIIFDAQLKLL